MTATRILLGAAMAVAASTAADARSSGVTLQDKRQAACYSDVQRLCGEYVPDVAKVTACMKPHKKDVSAKCRALWDVPER